MLSDNEKNMAIIELIKSYKNQFLRQMIDAVAKESAERAGFVAWKNSRDSYDTGWDENPYKIEPAEKRTAECKVQYEKWEAIELHAIKQFVVTKEVI